ncbi:MAG: (Fe-S)-binding protein [Ilumatobacteraceae bacterium]|nr:(Fe-S)-binding protein [Actinomycetota bacterium]MDA3011116.1 (Fe-S)-binding protein [Actinomycetota bacterium]MDA3023959.1 (Fe-S)-binding protein [Actinomycetota bacterium]
MPRLDVSDHALASCVGCGLCLPHCPTFRVTGDESKSPRGRIEIMRALHEDQLGFDEEVVESLDTCVQCRGCEPACPSGVPYGELIDAANRLRRVDSPIPVWLRLGLRALPHRRLLSSATRLASLPGLSRLVARRLGPVPSRIGRPLRSTSPDPNVWIFTGCVMDVWQRPVHRAVADIVESLGLTYGVAAAGHCCGALHAHSGWHEGAIERALHTMASFPGDSPVIVDSAGCGAALKDYGHLLDTEQARRFSARVIDVHEWLEGHLDDLELHVSNPVKVILQDPCHLRHVQGVHQSVRRCLDGCAEIVEMDDDGLCCGAGGAYSMLQPRLARQIRQRKVDAIKRVDPEGELVVASANPGCAQHLAAAGVRVVHPIQLVADARRRQETR